MIPTRLHGFYYTQKGDDLCGLPSPKVCEEIMAHSARAGFRVLSTEDYWLKLGRYMMTHCPQGYLGWEGDSYWLIYCGSNIDKPREKVGIHLVRFKADATLGYRWLNAPDCRNFKDPDLGPDDEDDLGWFAYVAVTDLSTALARATTGGGQVVREPWDVPGVGRIAIVNDNAGNTMGWMTPSEQQ